MEYILQSQIHGSCKLELPEGLKELMCDISREVLRAQPDDVYQFIAKYLGALLEARKVLSIARHICTDIYVQEQLVKHNAMKTSELEQITVEENRELNKFQSVSSIFDSVPTSKKQSKSEENKSEDRSHIIFRKSKLHTVSNASLAGSHLSLPSFSPYSVHDDYSELSVNKEQTLGSSKYYENHKSISWSEKVIKDIVPQHKASEIRTQTDRKPKSIKFHDLHHIFNLDANEIYDVVEEDIASDSSDTYTVIEEEIQNIESDLNDEH